MSVRRHTSRASSTLHFVVALILVLVVDLPTSTPTSTPTDPKSTPRPNVDSGARDISARDDHHPGRRPLTDGPKIYPSTKPPLGRTRTTDDIEVDSKIAPDLDRDDGSKIASSKIAPDLDRDDGSKIASSKIAPDLDRDDGSKIASSKIAPAKILDDSKIASSKIAPAKIAPAKIAPDLDGDDGSKIAPHLDHDGSKIGSHLDHDGSEIGSTLDLDDSKIAPHLDHDGSKIGSNLDLDDSKIGSHLDDSGGSEGGYPPLCEVFVHADGLGVRGSSRVFRGGLVDDTDVGVVRRANGTFASVAGDSWRVGAAYQGGRLAGFYRECASRGVPFGLLTTKCADDGTSSAFLVETGDRYDLRGTSESIARLRPAPFLVSGGFSRTLFEATSREVGTPSPPPPRGLVSHLLNAYGVDEHLDPLDRVAESRTVPGVIEFDTLGGSAFGETCEYPPTSSFEERLVRAVRKGVEAARLSPRRSFFLVVVYTPIDAAAHAGNETKFDEAIETLRRSLAAAIRETNETCAGGWRFTVVGSHATGGGSENGTAFHGRHSPPGTPVPYYRLEHERPRRRLSSPVDEVDVFARFRDAAVERDDRTGENDGTIVPGVRWVGFSSSRSSRSRSSNETSDARHDGGHHHHGGHRYRDARRGRPLTFWETYVNFLLLFLLLAFVPCCLCVDAAPRCN